MKKEHVPQDHGSLETAKMTEVLYITDENDNYTTAKSKGWEVKELALNESLSLISERTEKARQGVANGLTSPIAYFMELNKMDWGILASYAGFWVWTVKRHAHPKRFKKLDDKVLKKYADAFGITLEELKYFDGK